MKTLRTIYSWFLVAPVILPVIVVGGLIYPYLVPKTLLFYAFTFISIALFIILATNGEKFHYGRLKRLGNWVPFFLLIVAYFTSAHGLGFSQSFWSLFARGDGLLMLSGVVVYFYLILLYAEKPFLNRLVRIIALFGSVVALYGIGEWLFSGGGRIGSLLGNPALFAGYLGISFFGTLLATSHLSKGWRTLCYIGAVLQLIAIVLSATRGTIFALIVALIVGLIFLAVHVSGKTRTRSISILVLIAIVAALFIGFRAPLSQSSFTPIARIASISKNENDVASRLFIWKNMLHEVGEHPILGVGAEHIDALFNQFYDPTQIVEQWFDRSHNAFLDYAAEYGIFGFALYVILILLFFVASRRFAIQKEFRTSLLLALLAITYAVQQFFAFDTISSFWLVLALLAVFLATSVSDEKAYGYKFSASGKGLGVVVALLALVAIIPTTIRPARAAHDLSEGYAYAVSNPQLSDQYLTRGFALNTYGNLEYGYAVYDMYMNEQSDTLTSKDLANTYSTAVSILTQNYNRYSYDARTALYLASVLSVTPPLEAPNADLERAAATRAIALSPKRSSAWYLIANLAITSANTAPEQSSDRTKYYGQALSTLSAYSLLVPNLSEPHYILAGLLLAMGSTTGATKEAALGKQTYTSDLPTASRAASFYEGVKDWTDAEFFLQDVVKLSPADDSAQFELAQVSYLAGDKAAALTIVTALQKTDPTLLQSNPQFMTAIEAYAATAK